MSKLPEYLVSQLGVNGNEQQSGSGATSPGAEWRDHGEGPSCSRYRPRTFPYAILLPYDVEDEVERQLHLQEIIKNLYISVQAQDFSHGATRWTRELKSWLGLKFDPPRNIRVKLVRLYYELSLAPGLDSVIAERFAAMFMVLTKRKHYLRPGKDLTLDWRPLFNEMKTLVLPQEDTDNFLNTNMPRKNPHTLTRICAFAQFYFSPQEITSIFEEVLPYVCARFSTSNADNAFIVIGLLNLLLPTSPPPADRNTLQPTYYLPTLFSLWSLVNRSKAVDINMLDLFSRLARDLLPARDVTFGRYGMFSKEQSALIFTAVLRLLEIPVGQANSPYSSIVDAQLGLARLLEKDQRKNPVAYHIARWVAMSISPHSLGEDTVLSQLEALIQAVETFFHPSNSGSWTKALSQLVNYLSDFFVMRWNRETSGELEVPDDRKLTPELRKRFVLCLRDVTFMGIYSKSSAAMNLSLSALQNLAYLEPNLILPGALQRIYPAMQGLVEVHRTTSSLRSLQVLARTIARTRGFRIHVTTLLGLALPGIDANDLDKTIHTLSVIQNMAYNVPFCDLTCGEGHGIGSSVALEWLSSEVERLEREGSNVQIDYTSELDDGSEEATLRSSTEGFGEFLISFLGRVFTLLENLPDTSRVRSGSPEEHVINTLPAAMTPLLAALSPELYDIALQKITDFVGSHVIHQAKDAMAFVCNSLCRVHPQKALKTLIPVLIRNIRTEVEDNEAASTRTIGSDVLPRDRGLVWNISILSMCVVHVGEAVLSHKKDLFDLADYLHQRCKGIPTLHVSNFIHHLLLNLTVTYSTDYALTDSLADACNLGAWNAACDPNELQIQWHVPVREEVSFAVELFQTQAERAIRALSSLASDGSPIKRDGTGKEWSDEVSRNLTLLRLMLSGISGLFDPKHIPDEAGTKYRLSSDATDGAEYEITDDAIQPAHRYPSGYFFATPDDPLYITLHELRMRVGDTLHQVHVFLISKQQDDVSSFNTLYTAYRAWFVDVGIERSAHILDRVTRLFNSDVQSFKVSGLRKCYPRPLLLRRANLYHLQRLRHNAGPRVRSRMDETLLLDIAHSCVSLYTDVRRHAQSAGESAVKVIVGARLLVIPTILKALEDAIKSSDYPRIKGGMYSLLYGSLAKTAGRNWRYTPSLIKSYIVASTADKPSIQKLATGAMFSVLDWCRPLEKTIILDESIILGIAPSGDFADDIANTRRKLKKWFGEVEERKAVFTLELVELAKSSHWKTAARTGLVIMHLGINFATIAPESLLELVAAGTIDSHPGLRAIFSGAFLAILGMIELRISCKHDRVNYLLDRRVALNKAFLPVERNNPYWTSNFLDQFAHPDTEHFIDLDYPGWLVWGDNVPTHKVDAKERCRADEVELGAKKTVGKLLDRKWFNSFFGYLKQEPRDGAGDRFRIPTVMLLNLTFQLLRDGLTPITETEIKQAIAEVFEDGTDKHQHRATSEILAGFVLAYRDSSKDDRNSMWSYVFPIVRDIFEDGLTPENSSYWTSFLQVILHTRDLRRSWPIVEWLSSYRLDMSSNAAFKESSKILLVQQCVIAAGWHFRLEGPLLADFLKHLDHPYKGVREALGGTIGAMYRSQHHLSYKTVRELMDSQVQASSVGATPYEPSPEFSETIRNVFARLERWRQERDPGQQSPSSYTSASKTVLLWLDTTLSSHECTQLAPFFPDFMMPEMLHMMDVKEDPELMSLAYHLFRHLPNIPLALNKDARFISALAAIATNSTLWHQRLRVLINMQVLYFRRLFLISPVQQQELFNCVSMMLEDSQLEVRLGAATTLSGMIRCSPVRLREGIVAKLQTKFTGMLHSNSLPKRAPASTPTPDYARTTLIRHAAVLGLGALVQAFPYSSPPPNWLPEVLATLANKAAADPGMVGKSVKSVLSDFKKTRQDTWHVDVKAFSMEQLEDLEGVLWKSYFA